MNEECCNTGEKLHDGDGKELPIELLDAMALALRVLAHGQRLKIVEMLDLEREAPVHAICQRLSMEQSVVSNHLAKMKSAGILTAERRGKEVWYSIANPHSVTILNCIRAKHAEIKG